ncbi:MAG: phage replisome organizer N-terminal domain-containing protein [Lachnospiraceae bacterium]|nr:phage replisome organizer N-terminal domain-containing protein [Lachnospiraceae bacterium]
MADNKKYYYLKLKEGFFDSDDMKLLQAMKDGYVYSDILLKLYLQSLRQEGRLMYRGIVPYTPDMIATITNHQVGTVERAMKIFEQMGFIEILDNGAIYMLDIQNFIGQSSSEADRKRSYRKSIEAEKQRLSVNDDGTNVPTNDRTNVGQISDKNPPEYRDKSIEIRDKSIENINTLARSSGKQTSEPEADVEAIILNDGTEWRPTEALFAEYVRLYPNVDVKQQFNVMRAWCISNPKKRKTRRGITKFVNSWLAREQDKGYRKMPDNGPYQQRQPESGYSPDVLNRLLHENRGDLNG